MKPLELKLVDQQRLLVIIWENAEESRLGASVLRQNSHAASAVRERLDGILGEQRGVRITGIEPIGGYAVRLLFSDGHDRGIYPWAHLRAIADGIAEAAA